MKVINFENRTLIRYEELAAVGIIKEGAFFWIYAVLKSGVDVNTGYKFETEEGAKKQIEEIGKKLAEETNV